MNSEQHQQSTTIIRYFIEEAQEHLQTIEQGVLNLQEVLADVEGINELFRAAHSIKGGAAMLSLDGVQHIAHRLEDYFKILKDRPGVVVDEKLKSLFLAGCDRLQELLDYLQENFTISAELATAKIAEVEPIFFDLESHLKSLVALAPEVDDTTSWREQHAENEAYDRLMAKFQGGVAERLRDMLQLFKQDDNQETRQQLQETCDRLLDLGENLSISGWRELISASKSAAVNLDNPYLTLAQVIIRDIRQAQDLVLAERSYEIAVSDQLRALTQPIDSGFANDDELGAFVATDDLGFEEAIDSSDEFFDGFDSASGTEEDAFLLGEEVDDLDGMDDFEFDLSTSDNLSDIFDDGGKDISFNWDEAEANAPTFAEDMSEQFSANEASFDNPLAGNDELSDRAESEFSEMTSESSFLSHESESSALDIDIADRNDMYAESFEADSDMDSSNEYTLEQEFSGDEPEPDRISNDFEVSLSFENEFGFDEAGNLENRLEDENFEAIEDIASVAGFEEEVEGQIDSFSFDFDSEQEELDNNVNPFEDSASSGSYAAEPQELDPFTQADDLGFSNSNLVTEGDNYVDSFSFDDAQEDDLNLSTKDFSESMDNELESLSSFDLSEDADASLENINDSAAVEADRSDREALTTDSMSEDNISLSEIANTEWESLDIDKTDVTSESSADLEVVNAEVSSQVDSWDSELLAVDSPMATSASSEEQLTSELDEELSASIVLDELVELEALGFDLDDAEEEVNSVYQGLAASEPMLSVSSIDNSPSATDEVVSKIEETQIADFFSTAEEITNSPEDINLNPLANTPPTSEAIHEDEEGDLGLSDFFTETEEKTNEGSGQENVEAIIEEDLQTFDFASSDSSPSATEEDLGLADFFSDDTPDRPELGVDEQSPDMEFDSLLDRDSFDADTTSNVQVELIDMDLPDFSDVDLTADAREDPESSLDFELTSNPTSDIADADRNVEVEGIEDFSDLLAIGEELGLVANETNSVANPVANKISSDDSTIIQEDDASVLDDLGTFGASDSSLSDEADLIDLFADTTDANDIGENVERVDEVFGFDTGGSSDRSSGDLEQVKESLDEFANASWDFNDVEDVSRIEVPAVTESMDVPPQDFDADLQDFSDLLALDIDGDDSQSMHESPLPEPETFDRSKELFQLNSIDTPASNVQGISPDPSADLIEVVENSVNSFEDPEDTDITETVFLDDMEDLIGVGPEHHEELDTANLNQEASHPHPEKSEDLSQDAFPQDTVNIDSIDIREENDDRQPQSAPEHLESLQSHSRELADLDISGELLPQVVNDLSSGDDLSDVEELTTFEESMSDDATAEYPTDAISAELPEFLSNDADRLVWEEVSDGDETNSQFEEQLAFTTETQATSENREAKGDFSGNRAQAEESISQEDRPSHLESSNLVPETSLKEGLQDFSGGDLDFDSDFQDIFQDNSISEPSESSDLSVDLSDLDGEIADGTDFAENNSDFSDLDAILGDEDSEISEIFGLSDRDFTETDLGNDEDDGGLLKLKDDKPGPVNPSSNDGETISDGFNEQETGAQDSSIDFWEDLDNTIGDTASKIGSQESPIDLASNSTSVPTNLSMSASIDEISFDNFDELEVLLSSSLPSASPVSATSRLVQTDPLPDSSFDDLEALLGSPSPRLSKTLGIGQAPKAKKVETDEFDELELLLHDTYGKEVGAVNTKTAKRQALAKRSVSKIVSQTMKVDVKHLDSLNNLVGELVVNRNLLEQNQERLQQFIGNLLFKVQQLGDVAQRMRDQYDRSLLESSIMASSPQSFSPDVLAGRYSSGSGDTGGTVTATFEDIEFDRYNSFHILSQEIIELVVRVRESASDIEFVVDETEQVGRQLGTITTQVQDDLKQVRMVPFAQIADRLPRAVRDLSFKTGKQAELEIHGRETLIDKAILEQLYDPMTHLVNNAIVHGLEDPATRQAGGKHAAGKITIRAFHQGNQTVISISDDGAGINTEKVKQSAVKKGLYTQAEVRELTDIDAYDLLFEAGFSTKSQADELAGRGVGLDVVRTTLNDIRGTVHTDSSLGKGTTFTIRLPLTLSISKAMFCVCDRTRIAFPVDGFEDMIEVPQNQVQLNDKGQPCLPWRDTILPFQPLSNLLSYNRHINRSNIYGKQDDDVISVIVLRNEGNYLALQVDQFLGESEIVIKQLEGPIPKPVGIAGATILGDGKAMAIVSVLELFDIAAGRLRPSTMSVPVQSIEEEQLTADPTVLIVDDSITVRELLSLTFAKVGYRVEQARDGQDAWEKLRAGLPCSLIFCDIEMPRMDGLELLSRLQKDEFLSKIPVAMLTSRGADRHRQTAKELGAKGYFTKPYLEEELLSASHRLLLGEALV